MTHYQFGGLSANTSQPILIVKDKTTQVATAGGEPLVDWGITIYNSGGFTIATSAGSSTDYFSVPKEGYYFLSGTAVGNSTGNLEIWIEVNSTGERFGFAGTRTEARCNSRAIVYLTPSDEVRFYGANTSGNIPYSTADWHRSNFQMLYLSGGTPPVSGGGTGYQVGQLSASSPCVLHCYCNTKKWGATLGGKIYDWVATRNTGGFTIPTDVSNNWFYAPVNGYYLITFHMNASGNNNLCAIDVETNTMGVDQQDYGNVCASAVVYLTTTDKVYSGCSSNGWIPTSTAVGHRALWDMVLLNGVPSGGTILELGNNSLSNFNPVIMCYNNTKRTGISYLYDWVIDRKIGEWIIPTGSGTDVDYFSVPVNGTYILCCDIRGSTLSNTFLSLKLNSDDTPYGASQSNDQFACGCAIIPLTTTDKIRVSVYNAGYIPPDTTIDTRSHFSACLLTRL